MSAPLQFRPAYLAFAFAIAGASAIRADQVTNYPCSPKFAGPDGFCENVWSKTLDSTWMVFDVEFKKPPAESLETPSAQARLNMCNGIFFNAYQVRSKDDTSKVLPMPTADKKWAYEGLIFRRYYAHTVASDDIIGKMTFRPAGGVAVRPVGKTPFRLRAAWKAGEVTVDGRKVAGKRAVVRTVLPAP